jgi:RNA polymerase primary sigma factor
MAYPGKQAQQDTALTALIERAELQGYLTLEDILEVYPKAAEENELKNDLVFALRKQGVDILDDQVDHELDQSLEDTSEFEPGFPIEHVTTDDTVGMYLKDMSGVPLLTVEEEIRLAQRIDRGRAAQVELLSINGKSNSSRRVELDSKIQDGILAREHLIKANTRLVVSVAKRYIGRGVPFLDLIQEGNLGLMKSVEKYDYRMGFRFSTYATWWIRQTISRCLADQGRTIRVPVHMTDKIRRMYKQSHEMEQNLGRPPTITELAQELEVEPSKVQWMLQVSWTPISLESPVGDDEESEFGMFVEDILTPTPSQSVYENLLKEKVHEVLSTLSPREARIIRLRFGLDSDRAYTLEEVGQKFGLTRERIRQIEGKALRRLRHPCRARLLKDYVDLSITEHATSP